MSINSRQFRCLLTILSRHHAYDSVSSPGITFHKKYSSFRYFFYPRSYTFLYILLFLPSIALAGHNPFSKLRLIYEYEDFKGTNSVYAIDIDGDDDVDIIGAQVNDSNISWWENLSGRGREWIKHGVSGFYHGAYYVHAADMDGDGDNDI